jgi:hypothetical protein
VTGNARSCPVCAGAVPQDANYCPSCGLQLVADDASRATATPKLFGVVSPTAAFVLACMLLLGALAAAIAGSIVFTILLLAAAGAVFVLFYGAAERDPSGRVASAALAGNERIRGWTTSSGGWARAWSGAGRDVVRLRREVRALNGERQRLRPVLGDAAYRNDEPALSSLRARMQEIDDAVAARERARVDTVARARARVDDARDAGRATEVLVATGTDTDNGAEADDEPEPKPPD